MRRRLFILVLVLPAMSHAAITPSVGDEGGSPGAFLRMGAGARAQTLGGAFVAVADDPTATYWNPAGLSQLSRGSLYASINKLSFDRSTNFASAVLPLGSTQALAVSWIGLGVSGIEARTANTPAPDYLFTDSENALMISLAKRFFSAVAVGANLKLLYHKLAARRAYGAGFDAAMLIQPVNSLRIGFAIQNLDTAIKWDNGSQDRFPQVMRLGLAINLSATLLLAVDACKVGTSRERFAIGAEYRPVSLLPIRFGYGTAGPVYGAGLEIPLPSLRLDLDYGFGRDQLDGSDSHTFSIGMVFSKRPSLPISDADDGEVYESIRSPRLVEIIAEVLNVRKGPGLGFSVIFAAKRGETYKFLAARGNWYKIRLRTGEVGWVHQKFVRPSSR